MTGYDAADLTGMMEKVTSGATGALGDISMTGYSSDNLSSMVEKVTSGATGALVGGVTLPLPRFPSKFPSEHFRGKCPEPLWENVRDILISGS